MKIPYMRPKRCVHGGREVAHRQGCEGRTLRKRPLRLETVGQEDDAFERRHLRGSERMLGDRPQHLGVGNVEELARQLGSQPGVKHHGMRAFEIVHGHRARGAFPQKPFVGIEAREIVQESSGSRLGRIDVVRRREFFGHLCDAQRMSEAMLLIEMQANAFVSLV